MRSSTVRIQSAAELGARVLSSGRGFDYWESGMDLHLGDDFYDSFIEYQTRILKVFDRMSLEYGFHVMNASRTVRSVAADLRRSVARVIDESSAIVEAPQELEKPKPLNEPQPKPAVVSSQD